MLNPLPHALGGGDSTSHSPKLPAAFVPVTVKSGKVLCISLPSFATRRNDSDFHIPTPKLCPYDEMHKFSKKIENHVNVRDQLKIKLIKLHE